MPAKSKRTCTVHGCQLKHYCKDKCRAHYARTFSPGTNMAAPIRPGTQKKKRGTCTLLDCKGTHYSLGMCKYHYDCSRFGNQVAADELQCGIPGCSIRHLAKGMCFFHYHANKFAAVKAQAAAQTKDESEAA